MDCVEAKRSAEARAAVPVVDGRGQLQLGACQPLYGASSMPPTARRRSPRTRSSRCCRAWTWATYGATYYIIRTRSYRFSTW